MQTAQAFVGARGLDSEPSSHGMTPDQAAALKAGGIDFVLLYLGAVTWAEVDVLLAAGLAFMPVTYADRFDGPSAVLQVEGLHLPKGTTVWLDLEGMSIYKMDPLALTAKINSWADAIAAAGYEPGLYIGSPQPLTARELYALRVVRYWKAASDVIDRFGAWADPPCGFCMIQLWDSRDWSGVWSDVDFIQKDHRGRLPTWCIA